MAPRLALLAVSLTLVPPAFGQVVETEDGPVQILGLLHRTPEELERMIQEKSPGTNLSSGACAGVLKQELGFPEAGVMRYSTSGPGVPDSLSGPGITLLLLVEPEDAHRVRYAPVPPDSTGPVPEWIEQYERYPMGRLIHAIPSHVASTGGARVPLFPGMPDTIRALTEKGVEFLEAHGAEEDRLRALEVVRSDRDWINRSIAAAILTSFPEEDSTWAALAEIARGVGPRDYGTSEGVMGLQVLARFAPRSVDWAPAAEHLRAMLDGTNLFAIDPLMLVLTRTEISPDLAAEVLGDGRYVLAHLRSPHPLVRSHALLFLRQISGRDFGSDVERWEEWVASLKG